MLKFTFKTTKPTGPYSSFQKSDHSIKYNKIECGMIEDRVYKVSFMVKKEEIMEDGNSNCEWKWLHLKTPEFKDIKQAKSWVKENTQRILEFLDKNNTPLYLEE